MGAFLRLFNDKLTGTASFGKVFAAPFLAISLVLAAASGFQQIKAGEGVLELVATLAGLGITLSGVSKGLSIAGEKTKISSDGPVVVNNNNADGGV